MTPNNVHAASFLVDAIAQQASVQPDAFAFQWMEQGQTESLSYAQLHELIERIALHLLELGIAPGERVGILGPSGPSFLCFDLAVQRVGAVSFAMLPQEPPVAWLHKLHLSKPRHVMVVDGSVAALQQALPEQSGSIQVHPWTNCPQAAAPRADPEWAPLSAAEKDVLNAIPSVDPEQPALVFYTSGTGGRPNGAIHSAGGMLQIARIIPRYSGVGAGDRVLSALPVHHAYERAHAYSHLVVGACVCFAPSPPALIQAAQRFKPSFFTTVPLFLETLASAWRKGAEASDSESTKSAFQRAWEGAEEAEVLPEHAEIYAQWRGILGGKIQRIACAGAPLSPQLGHFFARVGLPIQNCYGLSEAAGVSYTEPSQHPDPQTVGAAIPPMEVSIAADGEVLVRGPMVLQGFESNPALFDQLVDEQGWFHTRDKGQVDELGRLRIVGRLSNTFKVSSGEYLSPEPIELQLKSLMGIEQAFVYAVEGKIGALLVPSEALSGLDAAQQKEALQARLDTAYNRHVGPALRIAQWHLVQDAWSMQSGELTPIGKLKRPVIQARYAGLMGA